MEKECLLGLQCRDFVMIAADQTTNVGGILIMKNDKEKLYNIADRLVVGVIGEPGDTAQFVEYISKNIQFYKMRNSYELSPAAAANFTQRTLAESLRTRKAYYVNLLMGGYDTETGPELYFMDHMASSIRLQYAAHGFGGLLSMAIMDHLYNINWSEEEAYGMLKVCVKEIHKRLFVSLANIQVTVVDKDGIRDLPVINSASLNR